MRYLFLVANGSDCSPDVIALVKQVAYEICFGIHSRAGKSFSHQERHDKAISFWNLKNAHAEVFHSAIVT